MPTIHGPENFTILEGPQPGDTITLRNKGIPVINRPGQFGDQIVTLHLEVPSKLNDEQKEILRQFEQTSVSEIIASADHFKSWRSFTD